MVRLGLGDGRPSIDPPSTRTLLLSARGGDRDALERLFERSLTRLQRWATGRLPRHARDAADTHDLVQDVLVQTFKRLDLFDTRGEGALQAYLRQALLNRIRDYLRRVARRPDPTTLDSRNIAPEPSPLEEAVGREVLDRYDAALVRLSDSDRELIVSSVELGIEFDELAQMTGRPTADAARKATRRALVRLAQEMRVP